MILMANILYDVYQGDNYTPNSRKYEITVTVDDEVDSATINDLLPNNGVNYKKTSGISYISTDSSATIYTPTKMIVASFVAEFGNDNIATGYKEGVWKILSSIPFLS
jgi:hypothetical protein